ncbi:MAG TPA: hypothetical protein VGL58_07095 [Caulobacteraceae bacterium]|jgi:hypothetical protein
MSHRVIALAGAIAAAPMAAVAEPLNALAIAAHASTLQKVVLLILLAATLAAAIIAARKIASGRALSGGSAFVSSLRLGGPIIGALGATYALMDSAIGMANIAGNPTLKLLAPGLAEAGFMMWMGFLAGAIGVIANWAIESRIDRQLLAG